MHAFVDVPAEREEEARSFWSSVLGWPVGDAWPGHPEFTSFVPPSGAPYVHVQRIDGPPRVHLDLVGEIERATRATGGARGDADVPQCVLAGDGLTGGAAVLRVSRRRGRTSGRRQSPGRTDTAPGWCSSPSTCRVGCYDRELEFWRAATGWADEPVDAPEFHRLVHRRESPLQLLVQRLGADDGAQQARAHLDLGTDDMDAEVGRVQSLGARVLWPEQRAEV